MNTKVTFLLDEEMIKILKEEFASQSSALKRCCTDDNEEAKKIIAKVDDLLSKLDNGGEFVCDSQAIDDVDDVEDFAEELVYLIECSIGIVGLQGQRGCRIGNSFFHLSKRNKIPYIKKHCGQKFTTIVNR